MLPRGGGEERAAEMYELWAVKRWSHDKIAEKYGVSRQRVSQVLAEFRAALPAIDKAEMIRQSLELQADVVRRAYELVEMEGAPVTAGKDGDVVRDPETDEVVRDYSARLNALKLALAADAELRKLMGTDSATKVESTATVRYEISGLDPEALK